jgi:hypothetical protein
MLSLRTRHHVAHDSHERLGELLISGQLWISRLKSTLHCPITRAVLPTYSQRLYILHHRSSLPAASR